MKQGRVYRLVPEEHRAWHAGASSWEGEGDVNARSIGIEIVNGGHDFGLPDFPDAQIDAVIALLNDIFARWPSSTPCASSRHSDIAPERKADPGEKFPWKRLADAGVSIWPEEFPHPDTSTGDATIRMQERLAKLGYSVTASGMVDEATKVALVAFQRRFRPTLADGSPDEETHKLLHALSMQLR